MSNMQDIMGPLQMAGGATMLATGNPEGAIMLANGVQGTMAKKPGAGGMPFPQPQPGRPGGGPPGGQMQPPPTPQPQGGGLQAMAGMLMNPQLLGALTGGAKPPAPGGGGPPVPPVPGAAGAGGQQPSPYAAILKMLGLG